MRPVVRYGNTTVPARGRAWLLALALGVLTGAGAATAAPDESPLIELGAGDLLRLQVTGRPEMSTALYVADDGTIAVPMAGPVAVAGMSPTAAGARVADALREARILVAPQVTLVLEQVRSQRISVVGQVRSPGRFVVESRQSVLDVLAQAGGVTESAGDVVHVLRTAADGTVERTTVDLAAIGNAASGAPFSLRAGDTLVVPQADQFYILGEVQAPNMYRIERGMTVMQALARGGGLTPRGSDRRIEIERAVGAGATRTIDARLTDRVQAGDVIRVKERFF